MGFKSWVKNLCPADDPRRELRNGVFISIAGVIPFPIAAYLFVGYRACVVTTVLVGLLVACGPLFDYLQYMYNESKERKLLRK
jgi:hypothetical protein